MRYLNYPNLELMAYKFEQELKQGLPTVKRFEISILSVFKETHSDTTCGFGGIGGQSITTAYTVILEEEVLGYYGVFINGRRKWLTDDKELIKYFLDNRTTYRKLESEK